jgi:RNA polymerase subunit RPABC4/transcription elongation factor Spt4
MVERYACKKCRSIVTTNRCPCGGEAVKEWHGYLLIIDSKESEIAKEAGVEKNGAYALRV